MNPLSTDARDRYFERAPVPLWAVDADDRTVDVNPAVVEALGYPVEELLGRSPEDFLTEESRETYRAQSILRRAGLTDTFVVTFRAKSGAERVFRVSGAPIHDGERYLGKIAVLRDVAVWNAVEGAMRDANRELLADYRARTNGTHDLEGTLQAIAGRADALLQGVSGPLNEAQRLQVGRIGEAVGEALERLRTLEEPPPDAPRSTAARQDD
jgi:PAS domain S-box-containing protein